jgi:hypothetical protein
MRLGSLLSPRPLQEGEVTTISTHQSLGGASMTKLADLVRANARASSIAYAPDTMDVSIRILLQALQCSLHQFAGSSRSVTLMR